MKRRRISGINRCKYLFIYKSLLKGVPYFISGCALYGIPINNNSNRCRQQFRQHRLEGKTILCSTSIWTNHFNWTGTCKIVEGSQSIIKSMLSDTKLKNMDIFVVTLLLQAPDNCTSLRKCETKQPLARHTSFEAPVWSKRRKACQQLQI